MIVKKNDYKWLKDFKPGRKFKYIGEKVYIIRQIAKYKITYPICFEIIMYNQSLPLFINRFNYKSFILL